MENDMPNTDYSNVTTGESINYVTPTPDLNEVAAKNPEQISETQDGILLRERAKDLYFNSHLGIGTLLDPYDAGWLTAKAHYESQ